MDQTQRAVVSAQILVNGHEVSLIVTHFSYDRESQCQNAWHILKYIHTARADKMVLMGDFNTYNEYHWPIELLLTGNIDIQAPAECHMVQKPWFHGHPDFEFVDAWTELNTHSPGFTFSNMVRIYAKHTSLRILCLWQLIKEQMGALLHPPVSYSVNSEMAMTADTQMEPEISYYNY